MSARILQVRTGIVKVPRLTAIVFLLGIDAVNRNFRPGSAQATKAGHGQVESVVAIVDRRRGTRQRIKGFDCVALQLGGKRGI